MNVSSGSTGKILETFEALNRVPRPSRQEEKICAWLKEWAEKQELPIREDTTGNIAIDVPPSPGYEDAPSVALQGHVDMVCEKTPDSTHDFNKDPIEHVMDGEWLSAKDTSLGADNGIAVAMAMVLAEDREIPHPALELLFTVDEETGLTGAKALRPEFVRSRLLLNLDSEDEGVFTIGCAGGRDTEITLEYPTEAIPAGLERIVLKAAGMKGGHSGVDIHLGRANAIVILSRALDALTREGDLRIESLRGGTAHNAIPREAEAALWIDPAHSSAMHESVARMARDMASEFKAVDRGLTVTLEKTPPADGRQGLGPAAARRLVDLVRALPHGVAAMSAEMPGLVETSNNLATADLTGGLLRVTTSQRSSAWTRLVELTGRIHAAGNLAAARVSDGNSYQPWRPDPESPLLERCKTAYRELFEKDPVVEIIHAGLECAEIGKNIPDMDMISFGPTIESPHSPNERLHVPSVSKVWNFLSELLKTMK